MSKFGAVSSVRKSPLLLLDMGSQMHNIGPKAMKSMWGSLAMIIPLVGVGTNALVGNLAAEGPRGKEEEKRERG